MMDDWMIREDPLVRAERYRRVAVEYSDFAGMKTIQVEYAGKHYNVYPEFADKVR